MKFDYSLNFKEISFREHPELYRIGKGEQGVLLVQPYKDEMLPYWRFSTPDQARAASRKIYDLYEQYKASDEFVGMDMARKFLQMGWTRSLRYYHHRGGRKYIGPVPPGRKGQSGAWGRLVAPLDLDYEKLESARFFKEKLDIVRADEVYLERINRHRERFEDQGKPTVDPNS